MGHRREPRGVDETYTTPLPPACPDRAAAIAGTRVATRYRGRSADRAAGAEAVRRLHVGSTQQCT